jgi:hypothetical protein
VCDQTYVIFPKVAKESLKTGKSIVVDNTNPSVSGRADFIAAAKAAGKRMRYNIFFVYAGSYFLLPQSSVVYRGVDKFFKTLAKLASS